MFDFKTPQFFRSENRASQKQLAAALRESVTKVRHASSFGEVVDAVLDIPGEHVDHKLLQLAKANPQADAGDLEKILTKQYIKRTAYASSAVGAGAALPGGWHRGGFGAYCRGTSGLRRADHHLYFGGLPLARSAS